MNDGGLRLRVKKGAKKDDILIRFPLKTSGKYISPALQLTKNMEMKYFCVSESAKLIGLGFLSTESEDLPFGSSLDSNV